MPLCSGPPAATDARPDISKNVSSTMEDTSKNRLISNQHALQHANTKDILL
jgi:hypothetical protein